MRERFDIFDVAVTVLVFIDLTASAFLGPAHPLVLRWALAILPLVFVGVWWGSRHWRIAQVIYDVLPEFKIRDNSDVWRKVKRQYRYVGMSGSSILKEFEAFLDGTRFPPNCRIQILLMNQNAALLLRESKEHELEEKFTEQDVNYLSRQIEDSTLAFTRLRSRGVDIEVRHYSEYVGYWAHLVDDSEIYLGPLFKGLSGLSTMVIRMKGGQNNLLLRHYEDEFERLWAKSVANVEIDRRNLQVQ